MDADSDRWKAALERLAAGLVGVRGCTTPTDPGCDCWRCVAVRALYPLPTEDDDADK